MSLPQNVGSQGAGSLSANSPETGSQNADLKDTVSQDSDSQDAGPSGLSGSRRKKRGRRKSVNGKKRKVEDTFSESIRTNEREDFDDNLTRTNEGEALDDTCTNDSEENGCSLGKSTTIRVSRVFGPSFEVIRVRGKLVAVTNDKHVLPYLDKGVNENRTEYENLIQKETTENIPKGVSSNENLAEKDGTENASPVVGNVQNEITGNECLVQKDNTETGNAVQGQPPADGRTDDDKLGVEQDGQTDDHLASEESGDDSDEGSDVPERPQCRYRGNCYRKNPQHRKNFSHPGDVDYIDDRPQCTYGTSCYRENPQHWKDFQHTKTIQKARETAPSSESSSDDFADIIDEVTSDDYQPSGSDTDSEFSGSNDENSDKQIQGKGKHFLNK